MTPPSVLGTACGVAPGAGAAGAGALKPRRLGDARTARPALDLFALAKRELESGRARSASAPSDRGSCPLLHKYPHKKLASSGTNTTPPVACRHFLSYLHEAPLDLDAGSDHTRG